MSSKAKDVFCRKLRTEQQERLGQWRSPGKKVRGMMSTELKSCDFCRLQQEVTFQALWEHFTGKIEEQLKEKAGKNVRFWGLQKAAAIWRTELQLQRRCSVWCSLRL